VTGKNREKGTGGEKPTVNNLSHPKPESHGKMENREGL